MMIPTIHSNGTGARALTEELETAHTALEAALSALRQVTVHGRDYYPQGPHAYGQARREMDTRLEALYRVQCELEAMHLALADQANQREARTRGAEIFARAAERMVREDV